MWQLVSCFRSFFFFFFFNSFHFHHFLNLNLSFLGSCPVLLFFVLSFIAFPSAVHAMARGLWRPSSKPFPKKVERSHEDLHLFLLLFLLLLFLFPCLAPSCACVSANTGAWIVEKPPAQLSSAHRSLWNGLTLCNKKIFFFFFLKSSITFSVSVCEKVSRSDWNCSTIEITEHKLTKEKRLNYFIYFNI